MLLHVYSGRLVGIGFSSFLSLDISNLRDVTSSLDDFLYDLICGTILAVDIFNRRCSVSVS